MMTTCVRYDSQEVESSLSAYLQDPSPNNTHHFYTMVLRYGIVRSNAYLRKYRKWLSECVGDFSSEDLVEYFVGKLTKYFDHSRTFDRAFWISNPGACLAVFFKSRAIEFRRKAYAVMRRQKEHREFHPTWEAVPSHYEAPDQHLYVTEQNQALADAFRRLPAKLSRVVRAKWEENKSSNDLATELGVPVAKVYEMTRKAKELLQVYLRDYAVA